MKAQKKQSKKAVTLLTKIEKLLADVSAECSALEKSMEKNLGELLHAAEASVVAAKEFITPGPAPTVRHKTAAGRKSARPLARGAKAPAVRARKRPITRAA